MRLNPQSNVLKVLNNETPDHFVYSPNYWQWFVHHKNHGILPEEIQHCQNQLDLIKYLGLDIFSRNLYCRQDEYWFGGICEEEFEGVDVNIQAESDGRDRFTTKTYQLKNGQLSEILQYAFNESTVVQKEFLIKDYTAEFGLLEDFLRARKWVFNPNKFAAIQG